MRRIQKTFSLEPMTSRMPSVLPAYKDNELYYFDDAHLKEREYEFPSNYGMIPLVVSYTSASANDNVVYSLDCSDNAIKLSFERLSNWYYFFKEYYHLLNDYGHCNRTYTSATEYYYYESGEKYADQMIYGTEEQTYIDLDDEFNEMGGHEFYEWICNNFIPTYYISNEYKKYWKRNKLYYPDVIKWIAWFRNRLDYETSDTYSAATAEEREHWNCKQDGFDCCDCEEYFNRGGSREYEKMKSWYNALQERIVSMNEFINEHIDCFIPTMDDKIQLHNSLDDLGQYSIFSKEYELGTDYRTSRYGDTENTHGGTVIEISGDTMILNDGHSGFTFSPYFMEKMYDEEGWDDYAKKYIRDYPNEFVANGYSCYTFDENNVMYTGVDENDVKRKLARAYTYDITPTDDILIDGVLYSIEHSEYGIYDTTNKYIGGRTFFVYREKDTSTPYTLINGKKIYAEWYPNPNPNFGNNPCYYFTFFKVADKNKGEICGVKDKPFNITNYKPFGRKESTVATDVIDYISYLGQIFQVTSNTLAINEIAYPRVFGYAYDKDNNLMYIIENGENRIVVDEETLIEIPNSSIEGNTIIIGLGYEPTIYSAKELSGQTVSRLTDLEATDVLVDDIGNKIDGKYNPNKDTIYNHQPPQGKELDLLYEVGNTSNIRRINGLTIEDLNVANEDTVNYFIGNIITDMVFYYKDVDGNEVSATTVDVHFKTGETYDNDYKIEIKSKKNGYINVTVPNESIPLSSISSSLSAITASTSARTDIEKDIIFDGDDIYCDVTYYIGATLKRTKDIPFKLAYNPTKTTNNYNYGVEYKETVKFVKENREYYLKKQIKKQIPTNFNAVSGHSVSYPIYVYKLKQDMKEIEGDVYNTLFQSPLASFKTEINLINNNLTTNYSGYTDMNTYNNVHVTPTFKQEHMLGISSLENIDSDIYIERGINAAFEKHLKLGEVVSMESLEQLGNGYFKIMES
jgi:hypothetical protein